MATYITPGGIIVTDAAATTADFMSVVKGLFDGSRGGKGLNQQTIPTFPTLSALKLQFPNGSDEAAVPARARVLGDGVYRYVPAPYNVWGPVEGRRKRFTIDGRTDATPSVTTSDYNVTQPMTLPTFEWPHLVEVSFRTLLSAAVDTDRCNVFVRVNGNTAGYCQVQGDGTGISLFSVVNEGTARAGTGTATILQGAFEKAAGGGTGTTTAVVSDNRFCRMEALVTPYYEGVGG